MPKNSHAKWTDYIPLPIKIWWREFTDRITTKLAKKSTTKIFGSKVSTPPEYDSGNNATVLLQSLPTEEKAKKLQKDYATEGKTIYFVSFLGDHETASNLKGDNKPISTTTVLNNNQHPQVVALHDHSMLSVKTNQILSIETLLDAFNKIPNDNNTVVAFNCHAGKGRSAVGTAVWLMSQNKMPPLTAMREITSSRSVAEGIPGATNGKLLNPHQQGYLGYAFVHLLAKDINATPNPEKTRLLNNFTNELRTNNFIDVSHQTQYILNTFRPLLSLPLGDMEETDRKKLYENFNTVRNYFIAHNNFDTLKILENPAIKQPLNALELSNLALLKYNLSLQNPAQAETLQQEATQHATKALSSLPNASKQEKEYFSADHTSLLSQSMKTFSPPAPVATIHHHSSEAYIANELKIAMNSTIIGNPELKQNINLITTSKNHTNQPPSWIRTAPNPPPSRSETPTEH